MTTEAFTPLKGHCACKTITYEVLRPFLVVRCCYCTWCQRETGTAFVMNAIIESSYFRITSPTKPLHIDMPTASGDDDQRIARCPNCYVAIYSNYDEWTTFVKVGTLDDESRKTVRPDVHIFTSTKPDWIDLTSEKERGIPIMQERAYRKDTWTKEANERYDLLQQKMVAKKKAEEEGKLQEKQEVDSTG